MQPVRCLRSLICTTVLCLSSTSAADEPEVWTGLTYSFASTVESPAEDMITSNVRFARRATHGLYNAASEDFYSNFSSPESTLWATEFNNDPGADISAGNWAELNFTDWQTAYGSVGSLASDITRSDAVVYLELVDVYLDLRFTQWDSARQGGAGGFSYLRAEPVPEPAAWVLAMLSCGIWFRRSRR